MFRTTTDEVRNQILSLVREGINEIQSIIITRFCWIYMIDCGGPNDP